MPKFRVGDRVTVAGRVSHKLNVLPFGRLIPRTGVVVRREVLGDSPPRENTSAIALAAHNPGAVVYVVRSRLVGLIPVNATWEEDEIEPTEG
jgi:hypothetical protein